MRALLTPLSLLPLGLLLGAAAGGTGGRPETPSRDAQALLEPIWKKVSPKLPTAPPPFLWQRRLTPPLPLTWPPDSRTAWVRYAFAHGFDARLSDGVRVAAPYARVRLDRRGDPVAAEPLPPPRGGLELGVQGVQPTNPPSGGIDPEAIARSERLALELDRLPVPGSSTEAGVVAFYGRWLDREAVIAGSLRGDHARFFDWLEAARVRRPPTASPGSG